LPVKYRFHKKESVNIEFLLIKMETK